MWPRWPETLEAKKYSKPGALGKQRSVLTGGVEVDDVLHREVPGLRGPQPAGHEAEQQDAGQPGLRGHRPPRPCSCGGPGSAAAGRKFT